MRAVLVRSPGGPEALELAEVPDPEPGPGEVLLDVVASGVNRADLMQREGKYPPPPGASDVLGLEVSGRVAALGAGVEDATELRVGDAACALLAGGGYAERVAVPVGQVMPVPAGLDLVDAAALPEVAATVWSTVFMSAGLRPGEVLLVHGGASGVGTMAVQLARQAGAVVAVTAGSERKLRACADLGATVLVDYSRQDFVEEVRSATGGRGADVVLDVVGGPYLERNLQVLATGGRLVQVGMQGGRRGEVDLGLLTSKRLSLLGATLRARPVDGPDGKAAICASVVEHVWPLVAEGTVRPVVSERVAVPAGTTSAQAAGAVRRAHADLEAGAHVGKVLLVWERSVA
ncbi:NAD(P)H-quinone oxidoreductase [Quadrisphaera setariae]|uniref:NAD(P)H-quinone oxidoreductase n=1 Tax=Quadrisphaera setariae TaxID=2593304 RepID=A0A5C8ZC65_9ACTN|nr:NAD(P)H-quinone oxidoreductase [Quadrisphaera setariae]